VLLAAAAEEADVNLVHYDRDYERIAAVPAPRVARPGWDAGLSSLTAALGRGARIGAK